MVTIEPIVPAKSKATTLTIRETTRRRLSDYKRGDSSFDDVLNTLMDAVPLEDVMAEDIAEHYRILNDPNTEWVDGEAVKRMLDRKIAAVEGVRRRSRSSGHPKR